MSSMWEEAKTETIRMLNYATQMEPHRTHEMCSLNEARRIIANFTPVMAEITTCIQVAFYFVLLVVLHTLLADFLFREKSIGKTKLDWLLSSEPRTHDMKIKIDLSLLTKNYSF